MGSDIDTDAGGEAIVAYGGGGSSGKSSMQANPSSSTGAGLVRFVWPGDSALDISLLFLF
jgi:hypothetical protein